MKLTILGLCIAIAFAQNPVVDNKTIDYLNGFIKGL